ncbi:MAG: hypothetical protein KDE50_01790, partial [Caldilineaceae bacterium]|nr:hypothetical protein [Caldilineaceae bacterium]
TSLCYASLERKLPDVLSCVLLAVHWRCISRKSIAETSCIQQAAGDSYYVVALQMRASTMAAALGEAKTHTPESSKGRRVFIGNRRKFCWTSWKTCR